MARDFPEIVAYGSAFRFALEAEQACADLAAAAQVLAPDVAWQDKLDEVVCTHDDRVAKLAAGRQEEAAASAAGPPRGLDAAAYMGALDADAATSWPAGVEQLIRAEEDAARFHDDFVARYEGALAARARAFTKSAAQDRAVAEQLREMLG